MARDVKAVVGGIADQGSANWHTLTSLPQAWARLRHVHVEPATAPSPCGVAGVSGRWGGGDAQMLSGDGFRCLRLALARQAGRA